MKRRFSFGRLTYLAILLLILSGCKKEIDAIKQIEEVGSLTPTGATYCRIESIWQDPFTRDQKFLTVLWDEYENPVAITHPSPSTANPFRIFRYDQWHRLREYLGDYGNGFYESWHFYGYDLNGRIGVDTQYVFGVMGEKPTTYVERRITTFQYDNQGRIIKSSSVSNVGSPFENTYAYDANGNLIFPTAFGIVYDNKVNFRRTHNLWMFLSRNYSMNNPVIADAYNPAGLPTILNSSREITLLQGEINVAHSQISYKCRDAYY